MDLDKEDSPNLSDHGIDTDAIMSDPTLAVTNAAACYEAFWLQTQTTGVTRWGGQSGRSHDPFDSSITARQGTLARRVHPAHYKPPHGPDLLEYQLGCPKHACSSPKSPLIRYKPHVGTPHPRHPSLKPGSPHGATLQPTHFYSTPIQFGSVGTPETPFNYSPPRKRKRVEVDENTPASLASEISGPSAKHQKRASPRTTSQKIEAVLHAIKEQNWTFPSFLYHIFQTKDGKGLEIGKDIKQDFTGQIKAFGGVKI
ncbi:hypothetical protein B0H10DRAFT_2197441 [Mycena sp. CBHHK59/15]|nr:hypothetical protein B0H10DRAFT_2197441 [Mycena sp. CBHHK59/15]